MTNIFAFEAKDKDIPYVFMVCDAQGSDKNTETKESNALKMVKRGSNLLSLTGSSAFAIEAYSKIEDKVVPLSELAEKVLKVTEPLAKAFEGKSQATFVLAGLEKGLPQMYVVEVVDSKDMKRGFHPVAGMYADGSGARQVAPALRRDFEQGFATPLINALEALALCFSVGDKAEKDMWVNDKLQIGMVSPNATRLITHPGVSFKAYIDYNSTYASTTGVNFDLSEKTDKDREEQLRTVTRTVHAFYEAMNTQMFRFIRADKNANSAHSDLKVGKITLDEYNAVMKRREERAQDVLPFVQAFIEGGKDKIIQANRAFYLAQDAIFREAENVK